MSVKLVQELLKGLRLYERIDYQNQTTALVVDEVFSFNVESIPNIIDLGAGAEYLFKNKIGIYIEASNLLDKSYQRYYNDNSFGLNFHGGIKFLF